MHVIPLLLTDIWLLKKMLCKGLGKVIFIQYLYSMEHLPHLHIAADWINLWRKLTILISVNFSLLKQDIKVINSFLANFFGRDYKLKEILFKNVFFDNIKEMKSLSFHTDYKTIRKRNPKFSLSVLRDFMARIVGLLIDPLFTFLSFLSSLLLPKCPSDLYHCCCPPVCDWGSRISRLVSLTISVSKSMKGLMQIKQFA